MKAAIADLKAEHPGKDGMWYIQEALKVRCSKESRDHKQIAKDGTHGGRKQKKAKIEAAAKVEAAAKKAKKAKATDAARNGKQDHKEAEEKGQAEEDGEQVHDDGEQFHDEAEEKGQAEEDGEQVHNEADEEGQAEENGEQDGGIKSAGRRRAEEWLASLGVQACVSRR